MRPTWPLFVAAALLGALWIVVWPHFGSSGEERADRLQQQLALSERRVLELESALFRAQQEAKRIPLASPVTARAGDGVASKDEGPFGVIVVSKPIPSGEVRIATGETQAPPPNIPGAAAWCLGAIANYSVVSGVSWGQLPPSYQREWYRLECDKYSDPVIPADIVAPAIATADLKERLQALLQKHSHLRRCTHGAYAEGRWVRDDGAILTHSLSRCAKARLYDAGVVPEFLKWRWQPDHCDLLPVTRADFCTALQGRDLLIIGDSLAEQHFQALLYLVFDLPLRPSHCGEKDLECLHERTICGEEYGEINRVRLQHRRSDVLVKYPHSLPLNTAWRNHVMRRNRNGLRPAVVLNAGAHFHSVEAYTEMLDKLSVALSFIDKDPDQPLLLRATLPGHGDCESYQAPLNHPVDYTNATGEAEAKIKQFTWFLFPSYNFLIRERLVSPAGHGFKFMNTFAASSYRPDEHTGDGDCVHWCLPSGTWAVNNQLLFNFLVGWAS